MRGKCQYHKVPSRASLPLKPQRKKRVKGKVSPNLIEDESGKENSPNSFSPKKQQRQQEQLRQHGEQRQIPQQGLGLEERPQGEQPERQKGEQEQLRQQGEQREVPQQGLVLQQGLGLNGQRGGQTQQRQEVQEDDPLCQSFRLSRESEARKVNFRPHLEFIFQHSGLGDQCWRFSEGDDKVFEQNLQDISKEAPPPKGFTLNCRILKQMLANESSTTPLNAPNKSIINARAPFS